jgi:hypothetical protein
VWLTIGYLGAIVIASVAGGRWVGLAVFIALTAVVFAIWLRARREERPEQTAPARHGGEDERLILVVANETVGGRTLLDEIRRRSEGVQEQVLVVCPALNSPLRHWASDTDGATAAAEQRLAASLRRLEAEGIRARGEVGDADPLQAIEDSIRVFAPDELVISTHPPERSHWLERGIVESARERFALPVTHVVVRGAVQPAETED